MPPWDRATHALLHKQGNPTFRARLFKKFWRRIGWRSCARGGFPPPRRAFFGHNAPAIVVIDAHPFKSWYEAHYGVSIGLKKTGGDERQQPSIDLSAKSPQVQKKLKSRQQNRTLDPALDHQFASGRILAKITSRPGQTGRCDGYVLEGKELAFYQKQMTKK